MQEKKPSLTWVVTVLGCTFLGGVLLALGVAMGNKLTGWPLMTASVSQVSTDKVSLFSARGDARINVVPDQAEINLGVSITADSVKAAQDQVNAISNQVRTDLKNLGVADNQIKTQNYSVYPDYDWSESRRRVTGYTVDQTLAVTVTDFNLLNSIIDAATAAGMNEINNIQFTLSDAKTQEVKKQARQQAIERARENASELASLAGLSLGKVVDVTESAGSGQQGRFYTMNAKLAAEETADYNTNIDAGETTYTYSVTLSYQTL